jgi:uncharacterized protein YxjI
MRSFSPKFDRDKFLINQRRLSLKEKYYVYDEQGKELFYVERSFGWLFRRRNINLFADDSKREPLLSITQDHYWEIFHRNYTVVDGNGKAIAKLSRNNFASLFRRAWNISTLEGAPVARAREDSLLLAAVRRIIDLIPYVELIGGIIKTDFHFLVPEGPGTERKIGSFNRRFSLFDKYVLDLSEDPQRKLDRRVALAMGILLDTGEKR